jgi:predicted chitinase
LEYLLHSANSACPVMRTLGNLIYNHRPSRQPMLISPPFLPTHVSAAGASATDDPLMDMLDGFELAHGIYPIAFDRRWHGGIHLAPDVHGPVHAIADGEVVTYRVCQQAYDAGEGSAGSNAGFVLLKHTTDTGEGRTITFYSLYMHLLDLNGCIASGYDAQQLPEFLRTCTPGSEASNVLPAQRRPGPAQRGAGQRVNRKDILGWLGACHGQIHLHFEIFMTEDDFKNYFGKIPLGILRPITPRDTDVWGHTYYVIPGGSTFCRQPPGHDDVKDFPPLNDGRLDAAHTLYVEAYFNKGQRYTRSWLDQGDGKPMPLHGGEVETDGDSYEYALYDRATKYYPDCPSDGYELLRFGRILSNPATLRDGEISTPSAFAPELTGNPQSIFVPNPRATWVPVRFSHGQRGYIDISDAAIQKLSDSDFPRFMDWQTISEQEGLYNDDGLCEIDVLKKLIKDASDDQTPQERAESQAYQKEDALVRYVKRHDEVRRKLRGFICKAMSEWDSSHNEARYGKLKSEGEFYHGKEDGYNKFIRLLESLQFWDKTGLEAGKPLWFFHPLQFIRHFRRCGWISENEFRQFTPKFAPRKNGAMTYWDHVLDPYDIEGGRLPKAQLPHLNRMLHLFGLTTPERMACFFGNAIQESSWLSSLSEYKPSNQRYYPWYGRGFLQLTWPSNYLDYWDFRGRASQLPDALREQLKEAQKKTDKDANNAALEKVESQLPITVAGWRNDIGDQRDISNNVDASLSAGFYWLTKGMARCADERHELERFPVQTDKGPRGYYRSKAFWRSSATVNLPSVINDDYSPKLNGFDSRCAAYASVLCVTGEYLFPTQNRQLALLPAYDYVRREK